MPADSSRRRLLSQLACPGIGVVLSSRVDATKSRDERAVLGVGVGEVGADTSAWLRDADEPIQACAAVYLPGDPAATSVLQAVLGSPTAISGWFTEQPWRNSGVSETLLRELVSRNLVFADILPVALAIAKNAGPWFPDRDWGLLLLHAFPGVEFQPGVQPPRPTSLDESQRAYLEALVENDALWDPLNGNRRLARMRAGIPQQREDVNKLLRDLA